MAKLPPYLTETAMRVKGQAVIVTLKVRWWHPLLWVDLGKHLWRLAKKNGNAY